MADDVRDLKLDAFGDLVVENGDLALVGGLDALRQDAETRLKLVLSEWFLAVSKGVDWFGEILVKNPNMARVEAIFRQELLDTPGITGVLEMPLSFDHASRALSGSFRATSDLGEVVGTIA